MKQPNPRDLACISSIIVPTQVLRTLTLDAIHYRLAAFERSSEVSTWVDSAKRGNPKSPNL
jgi:hypothetical protein